jgi:GNAT superfamily N-acetyltransferase
MLRRLCFMLALLFFSGAVFSQGLEFVELWKKTNYKLVAKKKGVQSARVLRKSPSPQLGYVSYWVLEDFELDAKEGYIQLLTVTPGMRGNGVGSYLFSKALAALDADPAIWRTDWAAYPIHSGVIAGSADCREKLRRLCAFYQRLGGIQFICNYRSEAKDSRQGADFYFDHANRKEINKHVQAAKKKHTDCAVLEDLEARQICFAAKVKMNTTATRSKDVCEIRYETAPGGEEDIFELKAIKFIDPRISTAHKDELVRFIAESLEQPLDVIQKAAAACEFASNEILLGIHDFNYE